MTKTENAIAVFTAKSIDSVLREGGSGEWKLDLTALIETAQIG